MGLFHSHNEQHEHAHGHGGHHHHHHGIENITTLNRAFIIGIALNAAFVIAEAAAGFFSNSLGLLSDAGHNLSDTASLILTMLAFKLVQKKPSSRFTYGYKKSTVLVSLTNAIILLVAVGVIIAESVDKFLHPRPINGDTIAIVAAIGVIINAFTAFLFVKDKGKDLNIKGAYLHMAMDALVSIGVVVSGIAIRWTGWYVIDPIIGLTIALIIVVSTWSLLKDSLRLSLDGVPQGIDVEDILDTMAQQEGVKDVHHLHVWALSTTQNALTAHVTVDNFDRLESIKHDIKHLLQDKGINHVTLEFEKSDSPCQHVC